MSKQAAAAAANTDSCIDDFDALDTATMEVIPPGGVPIATITFAGPGHDKTVRLGNDAARKTLYEERQKQVNNRWKPAVRTPEEVAAENVNWIAARIIGWTGVKRRDEKGQVAEILFTEDAARELLLDKRKGWLFLQCLDFLALQDSFTKRSAQS